MQNTFVPADILLPKKDFEKWSVIACDQYTSDKDYWDAVKKTVAGFPSAYQVILPEIYLNAAYKDGAKTPDEINAVMNEYLENGVFDEYKNAYIYVERTLKNGQVRKGIVGAANLKDYDYNKGSTALIRATEKTVLSRIPPRVEIRRDAPLELPHVMLLADDRENVIFGTVDALGGLPVVYDFDLMQNAGHIKGYLIVGENAEKLRAAFRQLDDKSGSALMFAVGDGNHSLATAKACFEQSPTELNSFALCEVVNIHDESLNFEPIYRVLFGVEPEKYVEKFVNDLGGEYFGSDAQVFTCVIGDTTRKISVKPTSKLPVGTLQGYIDTVTPDVDADYIHDEEAVFALCKKDKTALGFIFDSMKKSELFDAVKIDGSLPRKTFSMGHADDKRFYLEARRIK